MAWTTPKTNWATGELVTAEDMNAVGENLGVLERLRSTVAVYTTTEDISAPNSNSTFEDVDSENLNLTLNTAGGDVLIHFHGRFNLGTITIDVEVDGTRQGDATNGIIKTFSHTLQHVSFTRLIQNLSAGSHTFKLQTKNGAKLYAGAQFWVREV